MNLMILANFSQIRQSKIACPCKLTEWIRMKLKFLESTRLMHKLLSYSGKTLKSV